MPAARSAAHHPGTRLGYTAAFLAGVVVVMIGALFVEENYPAAAGEAATADGQQVRIVFAPDDGKVVVVTAIDLGKEWPCQCN